MKAKEITLFLIHNIYTTHTNTHIRSLKTRNFCCRKSNRPTLFFTRCSTQIWTQCNDIGDICICYVAMVYSCCWLKCTDAHSYCSFTSVCAFEHIGSPNKSESSASSSSPHFLSFPLFTLFQSFFLLATSRYLVLWKCGRCEPVHGSGFPLQNVTYSAIFLLCKYGNRFSVCACYGLCNKQQLFSCSFSYISYNPYFAQTLIFSLHHFAHKRTDIHFLTLSL